MRTIYPSGYEKPKGIRTVYGLPMSALIALCCLPVNPTETDKT